MSNEIALELEPEDTAFEEVGSTVEPDGEPKPGRKRFAKLEKLGKIGKAAAAVAILLVMAGGGYLALDWLKKRSEVPAEAAVSYLEVPDLLVNMRTADGRPRFLKVKVVLEVPDKEAAKRIETKMPLLIDSYQSFLRETRPEDLSGASGTFRIKEELLIRSAQVAHPATVNDVLIQELVQQ